MFILYLILSIVIIIIGIVAVRFLGEIGSLIMDLIRSINVNGVIVIIVIVILALILAAMMA